MSYEANTGLNVKNHYGDRNTGGTEGGIKTEGLINYYTVNFNGTDGRLGFKFPILKGVAIIDVDADTFGVNGVETVTIGGVNVLTATDAAPVKLPSTNTGVIVTTNITAGTLVIAYKRLVN